MEKTSHEAALGELAYRVTSIRLFVEGEQADNAARAAAGAVRLLRSLGLLQETEEEREAAALRQAARLLIYAANRS